MICAGVLSAAAAHFASKVASLALRFHQRLSVGAVEGRLTGLLS